MPPRRSPGPSASRELSALTVARAVENLESLYIAWAQLQAERKAALETRRIERERLKTRAGYLLNAVSAARAFSPAAAPAPAQLPAKTEAKRGKGKKKAAPTSSALTKANAADPLQTFHAQAELEMREAAAALETREKTEEAAFIKKDREVRRLIVERADRHLTIHQPRVALAVHPVGGQQVIVQAARLDDEDAVLLVRVLFGHLPTRWGFFSDDQVDDVGQQSPRLYADGVAEIATASAEDEDRVLLAQPEFVPARLHIPIRVPGREFPRFRLIHRGPVAELESRREGAPYSQVIAQDDAELLTGFLLSLKLAGRIQLEIEVG